MTMMSTISKWRQRAPFLCLPLLAMPAMAEPASEPLPLELTPYQAEYVVYRNGRSHGKAERELKQVDGVYTLRYRSEISWMVFRDRREEQTRFHIQGSQVQPLEYRMNRSGTGPSRNYVLTLDPQKEELREGAKGELKSHSWDDSWLDQLSYHQQLAIDLAAGKRAFSYEVLNRRGDPKTYDFRVVTKELLPLPYGNVMAYRIERVEEDSDRQIYAWVAPDLDYLLVRIWHGENNVEQVDVQLHKVHWQQPDATTAAARLR
ncbi:DUF3108 domain-containing protein [Alkalimonas mucilaginosa]|uniref:DUF3108 domain-containing protein n=1 Tax=Alkalimonas mucilaginosa TaxID=3057676 RepID=A0ABU7JGX3_9GAMM|nr:DUF3108 domain-containing protein [Alkalimonas sp. MEB004]MEE2024926.1 DUF3108 domain-containing protein [Alkalimonas sp. MEB004]